jgi:hypothetical protein
MKNHLLKTFVAALAIAAAATAPAKGQSSTSSLVFETKYSTGGATADDGVVWTVTSDGAESLFDADKGIHYGTGSATVGYIELSTSGITGTITQVKVNASTAGGVNNATVGVTVGGNAFGGNPQSLSTTATDYTFTGSASGAIVVRVAKPSAAVKALYVKSIEVTYTTAPAVPHTVRFASGNDGWTVQDVTASASATAPAVLQNMMAGDSLVITAPATLNRKVKSVKAVKYVPPAATVTTAPTATAALIEANSTSALVNAGAANGGSMMYAVTTTNAQPASTADFSATIPTAQGRTAGTYYVWYYAKADADHSDSEIAGPVSVTLAVMTTVTWNSTNVFNSAHENDKINAFQSGSLTFVGITISKSGTGLSSFKAYDDVEQIGYLACYGGDGDSFTFTAPSGKKFCKIEIINNWGISFTNYGDWTGNNNIVWSGTAANAVTLGTVYTAAPTLTSIVFKLIDAQ